MFWDKLKIRPIVEHHIKISSTLTIPLKFFLDESWQNLINRERSEPKLFNPNARFSLKNFNPLL